MGARERFDAYMEHLSSALGHADRVAGLKGYCTGLMLPLERKSVEPMAAGIDPGHASARHQALHHFVAKAEWSDEALFEAIAQWVVPQLNVAKEAVWIIDDTGIPKKGKHSVGVARQYCGVLGKQDNCQVAVSLSLATEEASVPLAYRLYLPPEWAEDGARRRRAGVPEEVRFATKAQIAIEQLEGLLARGAPKHCVLADAGYGVKTAFRQRLSDLGLDYMVGITSAVVVWPPGAWRRCPQTLCRHGSSSCNASAHPHAPAGERQTTREGPAAQRLSHDQLETGEQRAAQRPLCGGARTTCWRQRRSRAAASRGVAADRVAGRRSRAAEILPVDAACGYAAE